LIFGEEVVFVSKSKSSHEQGSGDSKQFITWTRGEDLGQ
jgi:hypothetical protein